MKAVDDLGYAPNFGAQALAAKRTNTFGAIVPTMENAIFARCLQALQEALAEQGITLLVASSSYDRDLEETQIRNLVARGADALFLIGHDRTPSSYRFLQQRQIPVVAAWVFDPQEPRVSVGFDNRKAMKMIAAEVLAHGHQRLALITGERAGNDRARQRYEGAMDALHAKAMTAADLRVVETGYSITQGGAAFAQLMRSATPPTAVMCGNDVLAAGAIGMARKLGISVPQDVSITGFDDIEIAEIVTPGLTTVHVPHRKMGRHAAAALIAMRNEGDAGESIELETRLVRRGSLGTAP